MRRLILAALLVLLAAPPAWPQANSIIKAGAKDNNRSMTKVGGTTIDSTAVIQPYSADGYPLTQEVYPDWGLLWKYQSICQNSLANTGAASDSSQAYNTLGANWLALRWHYGISPSVKRVLVALQVRGQYNPGVDSTGIAGWEIIAGRTPNAGGAATQDSLGTTQIGSPFEKAGAIGFGVQPNEHAVWLSNLEPSRDKYVMLAWNGVYFRAPYTSIRWRVVAAYDANMGVITTGNTTSQIDLIGGR